MGTPTSRSGAGDGDPWGDAASEPAYVAEINITPLVDVILVVLVLLLVSSNAMVDASRDGRLIVSLPTASEAGERESDAGVIVVGISEAGGLYLDGEPIANDALAKALAQRAEQSHATNAIVDADGAVPHRNVVRVLDDIKAAGFHSVGIGAAASPR